MIILPSPIQSHVYSKGVLYYFVLLVITFLSPYMAEGPVWPWLQDELSHTCKRYWYSNVLYFNNFMSFAGEDALHAGCMSWGWYMANGICFPPFQFLIFFRYAIFHHHTSFDCTLCVGKTRMGEKYFHSHRICSICFLYHNER